MLLITPTSSLKPEGISLPNKGYYLELVYIVKMCVYCRKLCEELSVEMRYSVSFKILALFTLLSCLAMFSMFSSVYMANSSDGDAAAINLAGSLRMQAWRLASSPAHISENLSEHYVQQLEEDLHSPLLLAVVTQKNTVHQQYQIVLQKWHKLKELHEINHIEYVLQADDFVAFVDNMVGLIEVQSQAKIDALRQLQYSTIFVTLLSILSALFIIRQRIIKPLNGLDYFSAFFLH